MALPIYNASTPKAAPNVLRAGQVFIKPDVAFAQRMKNEGVTLKVSTNSAIEEAYNRSAASSRTNIIAVQKDVLSIVGKPVTSVSAAAKKVENAGKSANSLVDDIVKSLLAGVKDLSSSEKSQVEVLMKDELGKAEKEITNKGGFSQEALASVLKQKAIDCLCLCTSRVRNQARYKPKVV